MGEEGRNRTIERLTQFRMQPVRADQQVTFDLLALNRAHPRRMIAKLDRRHLLQEPDLHAGRPRALGQKIDQPRPVHEAVFVLRTQPRQIEPRHAASAARSGLAVDQLDRLGPRPGRRQRLAEAERMQHPRPVRRDLQPGADLADRLGLFENGDLGAPQRQRARHGQPRDPGAEHGDFPTDQHWPLPEMTSPAPWRHR